MAQTQAHTIDGILLTKFDTIDDKARRVYSTVCGIASHAIVRNVKQDSVSWFSISRDRVQCVRDVTVCAESCSSSPECVHWHATGRSHAPSLEQSIINIFANAMRQP